MKLKRIFAYIIILLSVSLNGCILDSLNEVPLNIPITYTFSASGDASSVADDGSFCLDDNSLYLDYENKIKDIELLEITFRPTEVSPSAMKGDVRLIIKETNAQGQLLLDKKFNDLTPASYVAPNQPYVFPISPNDPQLAALNNYLSQDGTCFYVSVSVEDVEPATGTKTIKGQVDFVFKADTKFGD